MKPFLNVVRLDSVDIYEQLALEEALLRADEDNWCILNQGSSPAIVIGLSGKVEEIVETNQARFPIIRRFSGGGAVVVDEHTLFSTLILRKDAVPCSLAPDAIMSWSYQLYAQAFASVPLCLEEHDYVLEGRKVGGNAQCFTKDRFLHHTSFLWDFSPEMMKVLQQPRRQPHYRNNRSHEMFCTQLKERFVSKDYFFSSVVATLGKLFVCRSVSRQTAEKVLGLPHRKQLSKCSKT